ncbi:hypothetical protein L873DRAFT_1795399 [Choiromyces venosus 120613-1]|uniref:Uncharacterized protein n=1 Tax=Choiromyces venosus 120613-1 TaxID=1336337 RepID=A0A3N4IXA0_9PEZI|nr:hypothetical protein L873DRAFT_1795399 [Choiromyces venosus 120613-1]
MSTARIAFPPGLTKCMGVKLSDSGTKSLVDSLHPTKPTKALGSPILASSSTSPSPELAFKIEHLESMILTSTDRIVRAHWVHELTTLTVSLSAQLTTVENNFEKEVVRAADLQVINEELKRDLAVTEEALEITAGMLAVQAANAASAHASLGDEQAIATVLTKELVVKEEALAATTAMLNAQRTKLEAAYLNLRKKDQKLFENNQKLYQKNQDLYTKDQEIYAKDLEICAKDEEIYAKDFEFQEKHWAGETINTGFAKHRELLSRFIVGPRIRRLSDTSDGEGSGNSVGHGSAIFNAQSADLQEALMEKVHLLTLEEHRSSSLRDLLHQSIIEVGRLKTCLEEATGQSGYPLPESPHLVLTPSESGSLNAQIAELEEEVAQKTDLLNVEKLRSSSLRNLLNKSIVEVGQLKSFIDEDTDVVECSLESVSERRGSFGTESGNTSELSMATTQADNEEPFIVHVSDGVPLMGQDGPHMKDQKDQTSSPALCC